jgi:hypothetical protein
MIEVVAMIVDSVIEIETAIEAVIAIDMVNIARTVVAEQS